MCVPPLPGNALQIDTYNGYVLFLPVWFSYALVASHSPTLIPFPQITLFAVCPLCPCGFWSGWQPLFRFLLSIYLYYLPWRCIMIVFKVVSIRCNANIRYHFESYKTGCKPIFLYISYMIYIGTF